MSGCKHKFNEYGCCQFCGKEYSTHLIQELRELRAKLETANKIIDEYQQQIIPGFRERAEKAEEEVTKLRQQIEKMKNCLNCKYADNDFDMEPCISCQDLNQWSEE